MFPLYYHLSGRNRHYRLMGYSGYAASLGAGIRLSSGVGASTI